MQEKFNKLQHEYPNLSNCMILVKTVEGVIMSDEELREVFDFFVPRSDYQGTPKEQILDWMKEEIIILKNSPK